MGILGNLAKLLLTLYVALAAFLVLVLLPVAVAFGVPIRRFLRAVAEPATIAFGTANLKLLCPGPWNRWKLSAYRARSWLS